MTKSSLDRRDYVASAEASTGARAGVSASGPAPRGSGGELAGSEGLAHLQDDIARIIALDDAVLRNLLISQRYHDLSALLAEAVDGQNLNWSSFACWASKTAGESIRGEELPRTLLDLLRAEGRFQEVLGRFFARLLGLPGVLQVDDLFDLARRIVAQVSEQVADGNRKVFAELAPVFATFALELPADDESFARFAEGFRPGPVESGGQDLLRSAFREYLLARSEPDPVLRAQRMLLANCQIGLHEQTRLQDNIRAAMDAPIRESVRTLVSQRLAGHPIRNFFFWPLVSHYVDALSKVLTELWCRLVTRFLMRLSLPDGASLSLGRDIPPRSGRAFPPALATLSLPELRQLVQRFDLAPDTLAGSAPLDWSVLSQRMGFIVDLFRSSQQDLGLLGPPFSAEQRAALEAGRVPTGPL